MTMGQTYSLFFFQFQLKKNPLFQKNQEQIMGYKIRNKFNMHFRICKKI